MLLLEGRKKKGRCRGAGDEGRRSGLLLLFGWPATIGARWGMEELLSSRSNMEEEAAGRWSPARPVVDGGLRQGSSVSWIERGREKDGPKGMHSLGGGGN